MRIINKRRLLYCFIISFVTNGIFFVTQLSRHRLFEKDGVLKELYVKSLSTEETTFIQKAKYKRVAKTFFITSEGDSIYDIRKNTWGIQSDVLEEINCYIALDTVIYNRNNPREYQLISEFKNYSTSYSGALYFIIGPIVFTIWFYFLTCFIAKGLEKLRKI
jgi:hypothetical protein